MRLRETVFDNFRCFKNYSISYGEDTTVFIGKNGTGKSSVISGIRRGLSFMFAKSRNFQQNLATSNNAKVNSFDRIEANFDPALRTYNYPIENRFHSTFQNEDLNWALVKRTMNGGLATTRYNDALSHLLHLYNEQGNALELPVLAVIHDCFPHLNAKLGSNVKKILKSAVLPRDFGYYGWDDRTACIEIWLNRFYRVANYDKDVLDDIDSLENQLSLREQHLKNINKLDEYKIPSLKNEIERLKRNIDILKKDARREEFLNEKEYIINKLVGFTTPLNEEYDFINSEFELFRIAVNRPDKQNYELEFFFKDGRIIAFSSLPMGYKRIFSMVIDIAYRAYILNKDIESSGIVLIDEIELHLHPTLQQEILQRLRKTFPRIQFIVTTHSPLVISNFRVDYSNKIIKLEQDGSVYTNEEVENVFGIDYATNLSEVMEVAPRSTTIDKYINAYLFFYGKDRHDEANVILQKLQEYVGGDIPTLLQNEIEMQKQAYGK